jgi:hypothetical protein
MKKGWNALRDQSGVRRGKENMSKDGVPSGLISLQAHAKMILQGVK